MNTIKNLLLEKELSRQTISHWENGRAVPDIDTIKHTLLEHCAALGLFIVPVGELESWLVDYDVPRSSNKTNWIVTALEKLFEVNYDSEKEIWKFIDKLRNYLGS